MPTQQVSLTVNHFIFVRPLLTPDPNPFTVVNLCKNKSKAKKEVKDNKRNCFLCVLVFVVLAGFKWLTGIHKIVDISLFIQVLTL